MSRTIGARCQVCDGPVVNGRCKYCGMPYRNEEVLYHLNENRTEHYCHASATAKKIMKTQEIPAKDRKQAQGRTLSKEEIQAHQQRIRQDAVKRMTAGRTAQAGKGTSTSAGKNRSAGTGTKKRNSWLNFIWPLLIIAVFILQLRSFYTEETNISYDDFDSYVDTNYFGEWANDDDNFGYDLGRDYGEVTVGEELETGTYEVSVDSGEAIVEIENSSGIQTYQINDEKHSLVIILEEGEIISIQADSSSADAIQLVHLN